VAFAGNKFGEGMLGPCTIDHVSGMLALFLSCLEIANQNQDFRSSSRWWTGEETEQTVSFLKSYTVFNVEQIEGLPSHTDAALRGVPRCRKLLRFARA
jgi:hypothetical protein